MLLFRAGISLATYKGAENIDIFLILKELPHSLAQCYSEFLKYFLTNRAFSNLEFIEFVLIGMCLIYILVAAVQLFRLVKYSWKKALLFLLMVVLLPVACSFVILIAVGNSMSMLMSMGMVVYTALFGVIVPKDGKAGFLLKRAYVLFLAIFAWFQFSAVINDQLALKEGKTAVVTLTENIISQLYDGTYLDQGEAVAFVGRPGNNAGFAQSTAYQMANDYAKFGCWSTDARNNRVSWSGVVSNFLGVNLSLCGDAKYIELTALEQVAEMPQFPAKGSICIIDNVVVVKVSDLY